MQVVAPAPSGHEIESRVPSAGAQGMDFDGFYRREFASMVALAHTITGDAGLAEDIAQEAMSRAHRLWSRIGDYDRPGAWLRRVTINLALSRRRRLRREIVGLAPRAEPVTHLPASVDGDDEVWAAVATLPPKQRAAVALFYQEDLPTREIAEILGCSVSTATSHLNLARNRLAELLAEPTPDTAAPHLEELS